MRNKEEIKARITDLELHYSTSFARMEDAEAKGADEDLINRYKLFTSIYTSEIRGLKWVLDEEYFGGKFSYDLETETYIHIFPDGSKINALTVEPII